MRLPTTFGDARANEKSGFCVEGLWRAGRRMKPIIRLSLDTINMIAAGEVIQVRSLSFCGAS
jgi:hypothetical protein